MGQCYSNDREERYRPNEKVNGIEDQERCTQNGERNAKSKEHENKKVKPEKVKNKPAADERITDRNIRPFERVDDKNPVVAKQDVTVNPDTDVGVKPSSSTPADEPSTGTNKPRGRKEHHENECLEISLDCPFGCGVKGLRRIALEAHKGVCQNKPQECSFKEIGCTFMGTEQEMAKHLKESTSSHIELVTIYTRKNMDLEHKKQKLCDASAPLDGPSYDSSVPSRDGSVPLRDSSVPSHDSSVPSYRSTKKDDGKTIVYRTSTHTETVHGNKINIDNKEGNLNMTIIGTKTVLDKLFSGTGFSMKEARAAEKRQIKEVPAGCLVNLRDRNLVQEYVFNVEVRTDASTRVGILIVEGITGTCFRVGKNKIITALHVIKLIFDRVKHGTASDFFVKNGPQSIEVNEVAHVVALSKLQNAFVDFKHVKANDYQYNDNTIFKLKPLTSIRDVLFFDNETDCIVLEILPNAKGTVMPDRFKNFSFPTLENGFHIIGHPGGSKKTFDLVDRFIDPLKEKTKKDIETVKNESEQFLLRKGRNARDFPFDAENYIGSVERFLFNCTAMKGHPEPPGVVVDDTGEVTVVTMLLHGYPDWYYDPMSESFRNDWHNVYRVEQGANMIEILNKIHREKPELCEEIIRRD